MIRHELLSKITMKTTYSTIPGEISKSVRIPDGNVQLLGDLQIPELADSLVIFAYDFGGIRNHPRTRHVARIMRGHGLATLLCELLTEDEAGEDISEKKCHNADFLARRLVALTRWVIKNPDTKHLQITYFGANTGGAAALIGAAKFPKKVQAVVLRGGRADLAAKALTRVLCPTLLMIGENDATGIEVSQGVFSRMVCHKEVQVVPGASCLFGEPGKLETMAHLSADWLRHLTDTALHTKINDSDAWSNHEMRLPIAIS